MKRRVLILALLIVLLVALRVSREGFQGGEDKVVILKADWCGHCQKAAPEFERLKQASPLSLPDGRKVPVEILDADKDKAQIQAYGAKGFPTILVFRGGKKTEYPGERTYDGVLQFLSQ